MICIDVVFVYFLLEFIDIIKSLTWYILSILGNLCSIPLFFLMRLQVYIFSPCSHILFPLSSVLLFFTLCALWSKFEFSKLFVFHFTNPVFCCQSDLFNLKFQIRCFSILQFTPHFLFFWYIPILRWNIHFSNYTVSPFCLFSWTYWSQLFKSLCLLTPISESSTGL